MTPTVSCILPVYNGERFLAEALESVLAQSYPLQEILVVDDGSTDGTRALVESYVAKSAEQVRYLWQTNAGPAAARNLGITHTTGEFVTFIDADDLWHLEKTARQVAHFDARPDLGVSVTHVQNFWMEELREEEERMRDHPRSKPMAGYVTQSIMVRRTLFNEVGLLNVDLKHGDDTDWFMRAQEQKVLIDLLPDVLVSRRLHRDNRSRVHAKQSQQEYLKILHMARKRQQVQAAQAAPTNPTILPTASPAE